MSIKAYYTAMTYTGVRRILSFRGFSKRQKRERKRSQPLPSARGLGERCELPSGVRNGVLAAHRFSYILVHWTASPTAFYRPSVLPVGGSELTLLAPLRYATTDINYVLLS